MEYTGLIIEILIFGVGFYLYLFSIGKVNSGNDEVQKKGHEFRRENAGWLRILSLALMAIMLVNIVTHVMDMMK